MISFFFIYSQGKFLFAMPYRRDSQPAGRMRGVCATRVDSFVVLCHPV
jgi:hypothetical protein